MRGAAGRERDLRGGTRDAHPQGIRLRGRRRRQLDAAVRGVQEAAPVSNRSVRVVEDGCGGLRQGTPEDQSGPRSRAGVLETAEFGLEKTVPREKTLQQMSAGGLAVETSGAGREGRGATLHGGATRKVWAARIAGGPWAVWNARDPAAHEFDGALVGFIAGEGRHALDP